GDVGGAGGRRDGGGVRQFTKSTPELVRRPAPHGGTKYTRRSRIFVFRKRDSCPSCRLRVFVIYRPSLSKSAKWSARRPVVCAICSRQLKPSDTMNVSGAAARTAGSSTRSPTAIDTSYLWTSKPNEPAMPQQPASSDCTSAP